MGEPLLEAGSLVGQRGNPRPSEGQKWAVEVIDQAEGEVCVRYLNASHGVDPWWITENAWHAWKQYEKDHGYA
jgi:hypothetical protein